MSDLENKIIGLDLLQNPQKKKRTSKNIRKQGSNENNNDSNHKKPVKLDPQTQFKHFMNDKLNSFKLPLENFEKSDPFKIHLESCYYFWRKQKQKQN